VTHADYLVSMPDLDKYIEFLQKISDMGAAMKAIITRALVDSHVYEKLQSTFSLIITSGHSNLVKAASNLWGKLGLHLIQYSLGPQESPP